MSAFRSTDPSLFFSRNDPRDLRLGDRVSPVDEATLPSVAHEVHKAQKEKQVARQWVVAGYPDDEGISVNGGRTGAAGAPDLVRKYLYKMTPNVLNAVDSSTAEMSNRDYSLCDIGNLATEMYTLPVRHEQAERVHQAALDSGCRWISIGGGHDYGYPDAAAFIHWCKSQGANRNGRPAPRPLIINFDAHLDVRPTDRGLSSGTPFFRMLESFPEVDFAEIGIQTHCNSRAHYEWAKERGARILTQEEVEASFESFSTLVLRTLSDWILRERPVYLSIDIDGFTSMAAPGCSQSWATGFTPRDFFSCLQVLARRLDIRSVGIYEVSPRLDTDERTSKLAAQIIHRIIDPV